MPSPSFVSPNHMQQSYPAEPAGSRPGSYMGPQCVPTSSYVGNPGYGQVKKIKVNIKLKYKRGKDFFYCNISIWGSLSFDVQKHFYNTSRRCLIAEIITGRIHNRWWWHLALICKCSIDARFLIYLFTCIFFYLIEIIPFFWGSIIKLI